MKRLILHSLINRIKESKKYIGKSIKSFPYKKSGAKILGKDDGCATNLYQYILIENDLQICFWVEVYSNNIIKEIDLSFCDIFIQNSLVDTINIEDKEEIELFCLNYLDKKNKISVFN